MMSTDEEDRKVDMVVLAESRVLWYEALFGGIALCFWFVNVYNFINAKRDLQIAREDASRTGDGADLIKLARDFWRKETLRAIAQSMFVAAGLIAVITTRGSTAPRVAIIIALFVAIVTIGMASIVHARQSRRARLSHAKRR